MITLFRILLSSISLVMILVVMATAWQSNGDTWMSLFEMSIDGKRVSWSDTFQLPQCSTLNPLYVIFALVASVCNFIQFIMLSWGCNKKISMLSILAHDLGVFIPWIIFVSTFQELCIKDWISEFGQYETPASKAAIAPPILMAALILTRVFIPP